MLEQTDIEKIEETVKEFFEKMTTPVLYIETSLLSPDAVNLNVKLQDPQILIGEKGQTLMEIQRLLRTVLNKKTGQVFYLNLDINDYKKKKTEYLKNLANDLANDVALAKEEKVLFPMPAYERRIIHAELSKRQDVLTESQGEGDDRHIVIKPR